MLTGRVAFGPFEADPASGELWRDGVAVPLQDLPFRLLVALLERPGELVTRAELTARLWGTDTFVDAAAGLNTAVAKLRDALDDHAERPAFIETIPKRGYRFIGVVADRSAKAFALHSTEPDPNATAPAGWTAKASAEQAPTPWSAEASAEQAPTQGSAKASAERAPSRWSAKASAERAPTQWSAKALAERAPWIAVALIVLAVVAFAAYRLRADRGQARVAVVLFDNESGNPALARLAQGLTDATVTELTADAQLAVIGNAAVLRTTRPFLDLVAIRDAVDADYIVIGQVQARDGGTIVRAHLIRARDQAHVWVGAATMADQTEAAFQADVATRIRAAVAAARGR